MVGSKWVIVYCHFHDHTGLPSHPVFSVAAVPADGSATITVVSDSNTVVVKGLAQNIEYSFFARLPGKSFESLPAYATLM